MKKRDGAVDRAAIRVVADTASGSPGVGAATSREEVKASKLDCLKQWMGWGRSFWFHSPAGVTPGQPMGGVLWSENGGHIIYQASEQGREFMRRLVEGRLTTAETSTIPEYFHRMLQHLERKRTADGGLDTAKDYRVAGLLKPIKPPTCSPLTSRSVSHH